MTTQVVNKSQVSGVNYKHTDSESFKSRIFKWFAYFAGMKGLPDTVNKIKYGKKNPVEQLEPSQSTLKNLDVNSWQVQGRNVFSLAPKQDKSKKYILFLHGGGYVTNFMSFHWGFFETLANETKCTIIAPDYPLAPEHTYVDAFNFIDPVYRKLISEVDPSDIIIMGDSAGGGFSLALAQKLKEDGLPQPSQIVLLSPWLDISSTDPESRQIEKDDVMLTVDLGLLCAEAYTKGGDINSTLVCPINGSLEDLAKISVFTSTHDILYADAKKFKARCDKEGVSINYYVYPKMIHDWVIFGFAESNHALQQIKSIIQ